MIDAVDISYAQKTVDFSLLKDQVEFVIIREQYGTTMDTYYTSNVSGCKANNIPFSSYHYAQFANVTQAQSHATSFYNNSDKASVTYALDLEEVTTTNTSDLLPAAQAFIDTLHSLGVEKVGIYSSQYFFTTYNLGSLNFDWSWVARFGSNSGSPETPPTVPCDLWQYTSNLTLSSITENTVDANKLNGSKTLSYFIEIHPNNNPVVPNYNVTTSYETTVTGVCAATDADGDALTYTKYSSPTHGISTVQSDGNWSYTPNNQFLGSDSFKIQVEDIHSGTAISTILITVNAPVIAIPTPDPIQVSTYIQEFTVFDSVPIYSNNDNSSNVIVILSNIYSVVYLKNGSSDGAYGYVKYIDNQNQSYFGYIELNKIMTKAQIEANKPSFDAVYYQVKDGDSLSSIASANNITINQLKILNGFRNSVLISVGQSIRVK